MAQELDTRAHILQAFGLVIFYFPNYAGESKSMTATLLPVVDKVGTLTNYNFHWNIKLPGHKNNI